MPEIRIEVSDQTAEQLEHIADHYRLPLGDIVSWWVWKEYRRLQRHRSAEQQKKKDAWACAQGLAQADGLQPSPEMEQLIEREIAGEISTADIKAALDAKYKEEPKTHEK